ncbi:TPA: hypothetical protein U1D13_002284 [Streptococcus suis]|nr:hypothetical protein [Streptococcus suis]HEM3657946.1 hypothetical protein [Streptococcus suis]HEM3701399.1 hypothetical protein [Streptococcus suis]HEM3716187.1 hypothetical protein [Streptococcus suis]
MKKIIGLLVLVLSVFTLVACGGANELDGEYYWVRDVDALLVIKIDGEEAIVYSEGVRSATVNKKMETFEVSGFMNPTVKYSYKDGVLKANLTGVEREFYKKGTDAFQKEMDENGLTEQDINNRE